MIKPNLSITNNLSQFIQKKHESKDFVQREIVTRVAGVALPIFSLIDVVIHSAGMLESCIKGIAIKPGDFTDFHRHSKCVKIFLRLFIASSIYGAFIPSIILETFEDGTIPCVNVLLLSKYPEYSENCVVNTSKIVKYIKKHVHQMKEEDLQGMENTLKLLGDAEKYLSRKNLQEIKKMTQAPFTHGLTDLIRKLRTAQGSFVKTAFFRHCLTRLLSLGLSLTCALDLIFNTFALSFILLAAASGKLLIGKSFDISKTDALNYIITLFRDQLVHLTGTLTGSIVGLIDPDTALHLTDTRSSWYQKFQCKGERYTEAMLEDLERMQEGESLLIPLSFQTEKNGHIVYCLADKTSSGYNFTTLNTGYGSNYAEIKLKLITCMKNGLSREETLRRSSISGEHDPKEKHLANYTFKYLTFSQLSSHVRAIHEFAELSFSEIQKKANEKKISANQYTHETIYPSIISSDEGEAFPESGELDSQGFPGLTLNPQLMFSSLQTIGDCPKSSLLAALNYHSSHRSKEPNHQPFDKWIRKLQDKVLDQDGYLLDISFTLKNHNRQAKKTAKTHLEERWRSYTSKYLMA